jgi:hypothetical protein
VGLAGGRAAHPVVGMRHVRMRRLPQRAGHGPTLEPNPGDPDLAWYIDAPSLEAWFDSYVSRTGWWDKLKDGDEPDLPPWPDRKTRASS